jgi:hypothetical protein
MLGLGPTNACQETGSCGNEAVPLQSTLFAGKNKKYSPKLSTLLSWEIQKEAQVETLDTLKESMTIVVQIGPGFPRGSSRRGKNLRKPSVGLVSPIQLPELLGSAIYWHGQRPWGGERVAVVAGGGMVVEKLSRREPCSLAGWGSSKMGAASGTGWHPRRG